MPTPHPLSPSPPQYKRNDPEPDPNPDREWPAVRILAQQDDHYQIQWAGDWLPTWEPKANVSAALLQAWSRLQVSKLPSPGGFYEARRIIGERSRQYLVDWEDDEFTGEEYKPTWVRKADVTPSLVSEWQTNRPTKKKKNRRGPSVSENSASHHSNGEPEEATSAQDTRVRTESPRSPADGTTRANPLSPRDADGTTQADPLSPRDALNSSVAPTTQVSETSRSETPDSAWEKLLRRRRAGSEREAAPSLAQAVDATPRVQLRAATAGSAPERNTKKRKSEVHDGWAEMVDDTPDLTIMASNSVKKRLYGKK